MSLETACNHYRSLKEAMRREAPKNLAWYENSDKKGWHHTSVEFHAYLRLFYRVVWTSNFRTQTVFRKEDAYFDVLYAELFPGGKSDASRGASFLKGVAPVLGRHEKNRKNRAMLGLVRRIEELGWERFKQL